MTHADLLARIERFLSHTDMSASYFGHRAVGNSKLVKRLRMGRTVEIATAEKLLRFMQAEMAVRKSKARRLLRRAPEGVFEQRGPMTEAPGGSPEQGATA
ncbi:hypothetical protein [Methylobacterium nodulans]|uniref:Uncharacterized protein n=1 Tax=Methylobacterium nodulans (strain LMG 21967 / CNCM I-2342 / ORS 2060) TaxID=460265 RepID=B8IE48_METNO|nr:hypothetical protein [Methylobacterium nodulans]ACL57594.1 hypothetical protein Mnod_2631 [Methylobacterium nodulans ORS 2060]